MERTVSKPLMWFINIYSRKKAIWSGQMFFILKVYRQESKNEKKANLSSYLGKPNYSVYAKNELRSSYAKYTYNNTTVRTPAPPEIWLLFKKYVPHNRVHRAFAISATPHLSLCCTGIYVIVSTNCVNCVNNLIKIQHLHCKVRHIIMITEESKKNRAGVGSQWQCCSISKLSWYPELL